MCGICGVINFGSLETPQHALLEDLCQAMVHRGPDDQGVYCKGYVGLGARRLSIIDVDGGHQPLANEDGTIWIAFNGEIYNYRELRNHLVKIGHTFRTKTDTEVVVHLYEEFGPDALSMLDGIYAIAIWDERKEQVFLARDRMGIKPLYYVVVRDNLIFGSELRVVLQHPDVRRHVDIKRLNEFLSFEYVPGPNTIVKGVKRVEPGHFIRFNRKGSSTTCYWDANLQQAESRSPVHWRDFASNLSETLEKTIQAELVSDVPVGVFLSGGIDSSTVATLMSRYYGSKIKTFSIGFEDISFDETRYSRLVADRLETEHHHLTVTSKMATDVVTEITDHLDEPFGDSSFVPTYLVSKLASEHVKVVLGGDGSDEMFVGYPTYIAHRSVDQYAKYVPWFVRARASPYIAQKIPISFNNISLDFKVKRFLAGTGYPYEIRHHRWLGSFFDKQKERLYQPWVKPVIAPTYAVPQALLERCTAQQGPNRMLYLDMKLYLEGDILFKVDRASMANSLEVRVPFLNKRVVELATTIPFNLKLKKFTSKYILKKAMRNTLPKEIIDRKKKGFNMPVAKWINGELGELVNDMLAPSMLAKHDYFNQDYVQRLLREHREETVDNRKLIWTLLSFQMWHDRYIAP